jgi:valyl-tRNA synthetase
MVQVMEVIKGIRNIRGEMNVPPGKKIAAVLDCKSPASAAMLREGEGYVRALARVDDLQYGVEVARPAQAATQVAGDVEILLPFAGMIDVVEEQKRLQKEIAKIEKDVALFSKKLSNESFLAKAPADVLEKDRAKLLESRDKLQILQESLTKLAAV